MDFKIEHTWDGFPVQHEPVLVRLSPGDSGVMMEVSAPFFNDPPDPLGEPGKPFNELWDYEVVEAFFLNDRTEQYLEVELCPHGQHLVLLLSGRRNVWKQGLALSFKVSRGETKWEGKTYLPWCYFPPNVTKFNSFAIQHELQQGQKPDFHRLEYFKPFSFNTLFGEEWKQPKSDLWLIEKSDI
uniref:Chromosome 4 open reading frame 33 n=1 Tax=Loxodonta africana TaxID=9785 RepID=G3TS15_LOXAF